MNCYHCHCSDHLLHSTNPRHCSDHVLHNTNPHLPLHNDHVCSHRHNNHDHDDVFCGDDGDVSDDDCEDSNCHFHSMNDCSSKCHCRVCRLSNYMDGDGGSNYMDGDDDVDDNDDGDSSSNRFYWQDRWYYKRYHLKLYCHCLCYCLCYCLPQFRS